MPRHAGASRAWHNESGGLPERPPLVLPNVDVEPASPDANAQTVGAHHGIPLLAAPGLSELRHVAERSVDAPLARRVRVRGDLEPLGFGSLDLAPDARVAEEEALLRGEAVDVRDRLTPGTLCRERFLEGGVGNRQAPEVADVLA